MPTDNQQLQEIPLTTTPPTSPLSNSAKRQNPRKILLILIAIMIIITAVGTSIILSPKKDKLSLSLDNPLILKMAEKLPIPKITFVPITLSPTTPLSQTDPQPTSTPNQPTIQPSNWKTYNNSSFNFSLNYPSELTAQEKSHGLGVTDISFIRTTSANPQNDPEYQILIYPKTIGNLLGHNFEQFYNLPSQSTQLMTSETSTPQQYTKIENSTISGKRAFTFRTTSDPPDPTEEAEIGAYIELGENTLIISTGESNKTILDYILSTFKKL